ncbi:MAG: apolipoprotein N-acyltransferase [Bacteroidetes bacterium]|nr:apolipoprotein N-acyltransferase [Bacteroidota bacterium]
MKKSHLLLLALLSAILLSISWPSRGYPFFLFFAFIPLFWLEDELCKEKGKYHTFHALLYSYPAFFIWNILTTWWIWNSTAFGATFAVILNSFFMSLAFLFYHWTKKRFFGYGKGQFLLIFYWITFEFLHQDWDLTWSWLNLGSGFSAYPSVIQWYEYTGIFGGALWIFLGNISGYKLSQALFNTALAGSRKKPALIFACVLLFPLLVSFLIFYTYKEKIDPVEVVVIQPNIDPYTEQYSLPPATVMDRMMTLAAGAVGPNTNLLICPESAIQESIWENEPLFDESPSIRTIHQYIKQHPKLGVVMGASTFWRFDEKNAVTETARFSSTYNFWYDAFNTSVFIDSTGKHQLYHKSKLVVGVERMPFPKYMKFLENYALDLGGTIGSLGMSDDRTPFATTRKDLVLGSAICYESVYGEFFSKFVKNGATLMLIITNDGWWGNTPGHRQHWRFASLRAIETRRDIARSANTGISCFIDQRGIVHQAAPYWQKDVIKGFPNLNNKITFYTKYGDYIGRICGWMSLILVVCTLFYRLFPPILRKFTS